MKRLTVLASVIIAVFWMATLPLQHLRTARAELTAIGADPGVAPVLVELFTSEGCSSCPPADALLEKLDRSQPVRYANIIVLSEHVDYWDDIGWRDPYSSRQFSVRQSDYARRFRLNGPYTPQMVVDGNIQFVGSDEQQALQVLEKATKANKMRVSLSSIRLEANRNLVVHLDVGSPASALSRESGEVWIALADDRDQSSVSRGENAGRVLKHVAVVRRLTKVGTVDRGGMFSGDVKLSTENTSVGNLRVVAFVQETGGGRILGVGSAHLSNSQVAAAFQPSKSSITFQNVSSCLMVPTASASVGIFKNNCDKGLQFTIHWFGANPPQDKVYRVGPSASRKVAMLDLNGQVIAENEASFGIGPPGQASVVGKHTAVPDTDVLSITNDHMTYGLVEVVLRIFWKSPMTTNGKSYFDATYLLVLRPSDLGSVTLMPFRTDLYDRYEVKQLQVEDDPQ